MSFCSPTIGRSRPNTLASNRTPCSAFAFIWNEATEHTPKAQALPERRSDHQASIASGPREEVGVVLIARDTERMQRGDAAIDQSDLRLVQRMRARHEVDVAHVSRPADGEVEDGGGDAA